MRLMIIPIALCLIRKSLQVVEFHEDKRPPTKRLVCVNAALKEYLKNYRNIWIFSSNSNSPVNNLLKVPLIVITHWDLLREGLLVDRGPVIIFLEGKTDRDFDSLKRLQGIVTVEPLLMVCITDMICSSEMYMKKMAEIFAGIELRYVAVDEKGIIDVYEHTSMAEGNCGIAQLTKLGQCSDNPTIKKVFQTSVNFHECPIRVVTWPCPPYSEIFYSNKSTKLYGTAGSVVDIVTDRINATPLLLTVHAPKAVRQHISNREADLGCGELDTRPFEGVSYSKPYMFVQATVVAPHSTWTLTRSFGNILQPLGDTVWVGIGVVIIVILILRWLVPYFRRIFVLKLFGMFIGIPVPRQPESLPIRIYFFSLVLFGYLCSQFYLTNLTKVLASPPQQMIKTLDDLENSNLAITGPTESRALFKDDYPRIYRDFKREGNQSFASLGRKGSVESLFSPGRRDFPHGPSHSFLEFKEEDYEVYYPNFVRLLQGRSNSIYYVEELDSNIAEWKNVAAINDRFNWFPVVLAAPNTSSLLRTGNNILIRIWESGILNAHKSFTSPRYRSPKYLVSMSDRNSSELGFDELRGVFLLLIAGLTLSIFVFLIEIVTAIIEKKPKLEGEVLTHSGWARQRPFLGVYID